MIRESTNGPGDRGSVKGRVLPKTQKMIIDAYMLNIQHYKVGIKWKSSNPGKGVAYSFGVVGMEKKPSGQPWLLSANLVNLHNFKLQIIFLSKQ